MENTKNKFNVGDEVVNNGSYGHVFEVHKDVYQVQFHNGITSLVKENELTIADPFLCQPEEIPEYLEWLNRGGFVVWNSADMMNRGLKFVCPLRNPDGSMSEKPKNAWKIIRIVKSSSQVKVLEVAEVERIREDVLHKDRLNIEDIRAKHAKIHGCARYRHDGSARVYIIEAPVAVSSLSEWEVKPTESGVA